jgi:phenylpyruvate tautomerase PptA (4-oxalocrotonate tautomerase family)
MPLIELDTSCDLSDADKKQALAQTLSSLAAEGVGKPERYVMACVRDRVAMTMSGGSDACALVTIKSIGGLTKAVNQAVSARIAQTLQDELAIPPDRVYITFEELAPTHWGFNGNTFG